MEVFIEKELNFIKEHISLETFYLIIGISIILFIFDKLKSKGFLFALIALPGTFFHELSHYIVSLFTLGMPSKFSILPYKYKDGMTLGYVESRNITWFNGMLIGLAPLLLIPLAYYIFRNYLLFETNTMYKILEIYLIANLLESSIPSFQDLKVGFQSLTPVLIFVSIIGYLYFVFK